MLYEKPVLPLHQSVVISEILSRGFPCSKGQRYRTESALTFDRETSEREGGGCPLESLRLERRWGERMCLVPE